ncbi:phage BR0599 family protein [Bradyrhizobium sp. WSM3983]|uniref:phage BR0599 family protein n=1 Tax=Bradyrhizobium sp. WSM3983 TaxID=1038867 RepID=UPI000402791D|nr:phage BR0599 family protein [Bradyrhizobium sp. WSM3983]
MAFDEYEDSRHDGEPINLYKFIFGDAPEDKLGYTDAETVRVFDSLSYKPVAVSRDNINSNGTLDKATLTLRMQGDIEMADLFRVYPPSYVIGLVIYQGHADDPSNEFLAIWSGRVLNCATADSQVTFTAEPTTTAMKRTVLRRNYQRGCGHALYGSQCKAPKVLIDKTVTAIYTRNTITVTPWTENVQEFIGGTVEWTSTKGRREIVTIRAGDNSGNIQLFGTPSELTVGDVIRFARGCDHTMGALGCNLHANINNFGGQPWIPFKNPVGFNSPFS